jgi:hypothetical protein
MCVHREDRRRGHSRSPAVYLSLAILPDGSLDILGIWIEQTEGAKFWMNVFAHLKTRGCQDIVIALTDGLKGTSEARAACIPRPRGRRVRASARHSLDFAIEGGQAAGPRACAFRLSSRRGSGPRDSLPRVSAVRMNYPSMCWSACTRGCGRSSGPVATSLMTRPRPS